LLTLAIIGAQLRNPVFSNGAEVEKRSCFGGVGLGDVKLALNPQVVRIIKGILARDIPPKL
jgi:hypothetical protein